MSKQYTRHPPTLSRPLWGKAIPGRNDPPGDYQNTQIHNSGLPRRIAVSPIRYPSWSGIPRRNGVLRGPTFGLFNVARSIGFFTRSTDLLWCSFFLNYHGVIPPFATDRMLTLRQHRICPLPYTRANLFANADGDSTSVRLRERVSKASPYRLRHAVFYGIAHVLKYAGIAGVLRPDVVMRDDELYLPRHVLGHFV